MEAVVVGVGDEAVFAAAQQLVHAVAGGGDHGLAQDQRLGDHGAQTLVDAGADDEVCGLHIGIGVLLPAQKLNAVPQIFSMDVFLQEAALLTLADELQPEGDAVLFQLGQRPEQVEEVLLTGEPSHGAEGGDGGALRYKCVGLPQNFRLVVDIVQDIGGEAVVVELKEAVPDALGDADHPVVFCIPGDWMPRVR